MNISLVRNTQRCIKKVTLWKGILRSQVQVVNYKILLITKFNATFTIHAGYKTKHIL